MPNYSCMLFYLFLFDLFTKSTYGIFTSKQYSQRTKNKAAKEVRATATFGSAKIAFSSSIDGIGHSLYSKAKNRRENLFFFFVHTARKYDLHLKCFL